MDALIRNGFCDNPALVEAAEHRLCQGQLERAQRRKRAQDDSKSDSLTDVLLLDSPSRAANILSRYQV